MKVLNKERAKTYSKLFPPYIADNIPEEEADWKSQVFEKLQISIEKDRPDDIDFWMSSLDVYITSGTFSFTIEEVEKALLILMNFIISSDHWKLVSQACQTFNSLYRPRGMKLSIKIDWKPLYHIIQKLILSRSKTKKFQPPTALFTNIISLIRNCTDLFDENATQEMLDLWEPLLDPHHHSFVLAHCLFCLFLPVHTNQNHLWFEKFLSIWPMFRGDAWDYQWLLLFSRLSDYQSTTIDWEPHLPFLFNLLASYLSIPISPIDPSNPSINDYQIDMYRIFFLGVTSAADLIPYFTFIIVNLINSPAKETVRRLLEKTIFLLKPFYSPIVQIEEDAIFDIPIIFINSLISHYVKRYSIENKKGAHCHLPKLTAEDNEYFVELLLPIIQMERFCDEPAINNIKEFAALAPYRVIPAMLSTAGQVIEYERLQMSAIKTVLTLLPIGLYYEQERMLLRDFLARFAETCNIMHVDQALRIFSMFQVYVSCIGIPDEDEDIIYVVCEKAILFIETLNETDYESFGDVATSWIASVSPVASKGLKERIISFLDSMIEKLTPLAVGDLVRSLGDISVVKYWERAMEAKTCVDFHILRGIIRLHTKEDRIIASLDRIMSAIKGGVYSDKKEIRHVAMSCIKVLLVHLLQTMPVQIQMVGFVRPEDDHIEWHVPSSEEVAAADRLCDAAREWADDLMANADLHKKVDGVTIVTSIAKGIRCVVSNSMFDVIIKDEFSKQPNLAQMVVPEMKRHWEYIMSTLSSMLSVDTPDKLITLVLKVLPLVFVPRQQFQVDSYDEAAKMKTLKDLLTVGGNTGVLTHRYIVRQVLQMFNFRCAVCLAPYTKQIDAIIMRAVPLCTHENARIRNRCALFVQETSAAFPDNFGPFFENLIDQTNDNLNDNTKLSGLASSLCSCCQLVFTAENFGIISKAALAVCRPLSKDIPEDSVRSLRQFIIMTFEIVDFNEKRFLQQSFLDQRRDVINEAIKRCSESTDREVENYATALVISMSQARPMLFDHTVFEFLIPRLVSEESSLREAVVQSLPGLIEQLIPRVPKKPRVEVDKVTPENYDSARFRDRFLAGLSTQEPEFLPLEELCDLEVLKRYFDDAENRINSIRYLATALMDKEFISQICKCLVNSQVHQEESYSKVRVQFWVSCIRLLGKGFAVLLLHEMESLTVHGSIVAQHVIAGELFSSVMFALKGWKFSVVQELMPIIVPFIRRVVKEGESDFQSVWFVSVVCGISDHDPRRFFWLFDNLLDIIPTSFNQIREVKTASLVVDILLEFAWRIPALVQPIIDKAIVPMFDERVQKFEQVRECSIRAISSLFATFFKLGDPSIPKQVEDVFDYIIKTKKNDSFLIAWLTAQFTTQALSSFVVNRLALGYISEWLDISLGKTEDEEKRARGCLLHLVRSNWLWACAEQPVTVERARGIIRKVLGQLSLENRQWQGQSVILFLNSAFFDTNCFFVEDEDVVKLAEDVVMPALANPNFDVLESAAEVLALLLKSSEALRARIPGYVTKYRQALFSGETTQERLAGAKFLIAVIQSTLLFDNVPDFVCEAFAALTEAQQNNAALEPVISQALSDFWSIHEQNLIEDVARVLAPYRESVRPSYFC